MFVAVWPPDGVRAALAGLERPRHPDVRWSHPASWHVTLRFLGEVRDPGPPGAALAAVPGMLRGDPRSDPGTRSGATAEPGACPPSHPRRPGPPVAVLGPAVSWFPGRRVLQVPVTGLDRLATAVHAATRASVPDPAGGAPEPPFRGHVTLARARGRRRGPAELAGAPVEATWPVDEVTLVASTGGAAPRYEVLTAVAL